MSRGVDAACGTSAGADRTPDGAGSTPGDAGRLAEAVALMARIRREGHWESEQTHETLLPYLIEESWELVDAVADGDRDELISELGDLLLQVLFHSAIGAERKNDAFDVQDVAGALMDKLRRRAPYWFDDSAGAEVDAAAAGSATSDSATPDAAEQDRLWQEAKAAERADQPPRGVVDGLPWGMPALALGQKVLARARASGFPDDLVPDEMRVVHVDAAESLFSRRATDADHVADVSSSTAYESGSAEVAYRQVVRRFAARIRAAETHLGGPSSIADVTPEDWRDAWT